MIREICEKINFPAESIPVFEEAFDIIRKTDHALEDLYEAMDQFYMNKWDFGYDELVKKVAADIGVHLFTTEAIFLLLASQPMHYLYQQKGYSEELYWDNLADVTTKLNECWNIHHIWGVGGSAWFQEGFCLRRFKLGRLQYEEREFPLDDYKGIIKKGELAFKVHIPSCGPLPKTEVLKSFEIAKEFYKGKLNGRPAVFTCSTWLISPVHYEKVFAPGSNLRNFADVFDIISYSEDPENHNCVRVFYRDYDPKELDSFPEDTSLQKSFKAFFKEGGCMSNGFGIYVLP